MSKYLKTPKSATNFAPPVLTYPGTNGPQSDLPLAPKPGAEKTAAYHANEDFYYEVGDDYDVDAVVSFETQGGAQGDLSQLTEIALEDIPENVQVVLPSAQPRQ